jgi:hypothetical protein
MLDVEPSVLDKLQQWVFSLSSTNFRPFRHTATVISLGFITTLCEIYAKVNKAHDNSNMSLEKEKKGKKTARIKELERMAEEQERQLKTLTDLMESTYDRYPLFSVDLTAVFLYIDLEMLIIVFERNVFMNSDCGCRDYLKFTLTPLTYDTWAGPCLIRYPL